jgi:hypothetical protein
MAGRKFKGQMFVRTVKNMEIIRQEGNSSCEKRSEVNIEDAFLLRYGAVRLGRQVAYYIVLYRV